MPRLLALPAPVLALLVALVLATPVVGLAGCDDEPEEPAEKPMMGADGRGRWVVAFADAEPDLAEYRSLAKDNPSGAEAFAERARKKLSTSHADFESSLQALSGRIVERWWMSSSLTIEVDASAVPSLRESPGVKSIRPDVALGE